MSPIRFSPSFLKEGRWYEYLIRFALGGAVTVLTGFISSRYGPFVGGVFLALPAIFCASATLIEKHEIRPQARSGACRQTPRTNGGRRRCRWRRARRTRHAGLRDRFFDTNNARQHPHRLPWRIIRVACYRGSGLVRAPKNALRADSRTG